MSQKEVIQVAKELQTKQDDTVEAYGVVAKLVSVPVGVIQDALINIDVPTVPTWYNEDKGRDEENPNDPSYLLSVENYNQRKGIVSTEAMCMFGIEFESGWPTKDDSWLKRLRFMHKIGTLDLSKYDFDDSTDQEFLFKRYILGSANVVTRIGQKTGVTKEAIAQAKSGFPSNS